MDPTKYQARAHRVLEFICAQPESRVSLFSHGKLKSNLSLLEISRPSLSLQVMISRNGWSSWGRARI